MTMWWKAALQRVRIRGHGGFYPRDAGGSWIWGMGREAARWRLPAAGPVVDEWSAAHWVMDLLRGRPDLRARFPRALSDGPDGSFARWLADGGARSLGVAPDADRHIARVFAADLSLRPRQLYFWRDDLRAAFPLGLLPAGLRGLARWMLRHGRAEESLRIEEIWWFLIGCAEDPAAELVRTYRFTPEWQREHPCGLTLFGQDALAAWIAQRYRLPRSDWLDPRCWPTGLSPAEAIRLAYFAHESWREAHPAAFDTAARARKLLEWLASLGADLTAQQSDWCAARLTDGTPAALAGLGVNLIGHFCYPSGLRVSAEAMADGVEATGTRVARRDVRTDRNDDPRHTAFGGLEVHDVTVIHCQPEPFFDDVFPKADLSARIPAPYRVAYWYWELESAPQSWADKARGVDEVWAATNFVAEALRRVVPVPVHRLPTGVRINPFVRRPRETFGLSAEPDRFAFLFSFHMASVVERKNPLGLIRAFRAAFDPAEPVDLVLKVTTFGRHDARLAELAEAAQGANIQILDRVLTSDETLSLIDCCDAYVSLHRSEGLGLTMAEAMLLGKPVIGTRYSGNLDFMDDENSLLVDCRMVPLGQAMPPYDAGANWAEPSVDHAARLMRRLYANQAWARDLGTRAKADMATRLSPEAAAQGIIRRLAAIGASRGVSRARDRVVVGATGS